MMGQTTRWLGLVVLVAFMMTAVPAGSAGASSNHSTTPTTTVNCGTQPVGPEELNNMPGCLAAQFPDDYGGVFAVPDTTGAHWVIAEVHHTPLLETAAVDGLHRLTVSFKLVSHTLAELNQVRQSISSKSAFLEKWGVKWFGVGINEETNVVTVKVIRKETLPKALRYFKQHFPGIVKVTFETIRRNRV
jgi:hypothetical protein